MLSLVKIEMHGAQQGKHTGYMYWPGFILAHLNNNTTRYMGDISHNEAIIKLKELGIATSEYERNAAEAEAKRAYPAKPLTAELYLHNNYGYEKPVWLGEWQWSSTFGRWGRVVTFEDGWHGFTYPKFPDENTGGRAQFPVAD